jgi:HlyD family secretion protein
MQRFFRAFFAIASVSLAAGLLALAIYFIGSNTPREKLGEVRRLPPTSPSSLSVAAHPPAASFIGGVGIVEPEGEATVIGSQLPGVVEEVCVEPGDQVVQGAPLLRLDRRSALADLTVAQAELTAQTARLAELQAQLEPQRARVEAAQALVDQYRAAEANAEREYERADAIQGNFALSEEEVDLRRLNWETAKARRFEADARLHEARANLDLLAGEPIAASMEVQRAAVEQARASVQRAQTNLDLRTILAPKDATVLSVKIRVGEFIPASILATPLITLGVTQPLHIRVDIDESEIPRFTPQAAAYASVRGRPELRVPLHYVRTEPLVIPKRSLTGTVSERVDTRVLQVIYRVAPETLQAVVGQQVDIYIADKVPLR